jgi:pimeloyl-ACP methyl ester carboxylesterase
MAGGFPGELHAGREAELVVDMAQGQLHRPRRDEKPCPVRGFTLEEKLTKGWPLVEIYHFTGPIGFLKKQLCDSLLGSEAVAAQPDQATTVIASFAEAERSGMFHAMRSMMLHRSGVEALLPRIAVPTLVMSVRDDAMGWRPDEARQTCATIPDCRVEEVAGGGHVAPLLVDGDRILDLVTEFWSSVSRRADAKSPDTPRK